ncbi:MAG: GntR family transcriptional regulator [Rhizobiales bacterium]|nr:GntR family transcriptional regulator [Hyphomicrobiales bacterium]
MSLDFEPLEYADLTALTYRAIRGRILHRQLKSGDQIPIDVIAAAIGVSRTPVVDALKQLASEGLVEIRPRRGSFVRTLHAQDIREMFEIREVIELHCARKAASAPAPALVERLFSALEQMCAATKGDIYTDYDSFIEWDQNFHIAIVESSNNSQIQEIYSRLKVHMHIARSHHITPLETPIDVHREHRSIAEAIAVGSPEKAAVAVATHLSAVKRQFIINIEEAGGVL